MANSSRILFAFKTQSQPISLWSISTWNIVYLNEMQETSNSKRPQKWNNQANRSIAMSKAGAVNRTGSWEMGERERERKEMKKVIKNDIFTITNTQNTGKAKWNLKKRHRIIEHLIHLESGRRIKTKALGQCMRCDYMNTHYAHYVLSVCDVQH